MAELVQRVDEQVLLWITQHLRLPVLNELISFYTSLGNAGLVFILGAVVLFLIVLLVSLAIVRRRRRKRRSVIHVRDSKKHRKPKFY